MKGASKSKEPRHAKQQSQRILSFREGEYQDSNKKIPSVARGSYLMRRSHKKQLISSGNCCKTAVTGGKSGPSLKQNQTAAFWRGGRLRLAMPKMKEQNSRSRKEADGCLQEGAKHQNLFLCRPHLQSNTNRRLCQGGNRKNFSMRHFRYKVANFSKFFENHCKI